MTNLIISVSAFCGVIIGIGLERWRWERSADNDCRIESRGRLFKVEHAE